MEPILTMIPGPTPVRQSILDALAKPTVAHVAPSFVDSYRRALADLKRVVMTETAQPFLVAGSGTFAMEMALVNTVPTDQKLLVLSQGFFGDRWAQIGEAFGHEVELVQAEWGKVASPEELEKRLRSGSFAAVCMTHVDTSTGAAAPVSDYCEVLRGRDELVLLDGVCATAGMEERFDDWGVDVLITGAQKALGAPPGVAIAVASERAMERRRRRESVSAYSADFLRWLPIMEDPGKYFSTPPVNEILAMQESFAIVLDEGLENRFRRHGRIARAARAGLAALGMRPFTDEAHLADTLSVPCYPEGVEDAAFRGEMAKRGVIVAGALGAIAGKAVRIGHMGNIGSAEVCRMLNAVEGSLRTLGHEVVPGSAVAAAAPQLVG